MSKLSNKPIVIIGGGPAGYKSALELRKQFSEQEIVLIEKYKLGGACLHLGCIPSKLLHTIKDLSDYPKLIKKNKMILEKGVAAELKNANIEVVIAEAKLSKARIATSPSAPRNDTEISAPCNDAGIIVKAGDKNFEPSHLIVATGSKPKTLKDYPNALSSDSFFAEENLKEGFSEKYCFIGGGYIGVEIASMLAHHGKKVRIIEMLDEILQFLDPLIREKLLEEFKKAGVEIQTGIKDLKEANIQDDETVFVSIGREISLPKINGEDLKENDYIHILGDASNQMALAHYGYAQARELAYKLAGKDYPKIDKAKVPLVVFSHPEVASIGLTSNHAKEKYGEIEEIIIPWASNGKARLSGHERGQTKWIIRKDDKKVLGCHLIGHGASDLISIVVPIINMNLNTDQMMSWIYPHPTIGEIFAF